MADTLKASGLKKGAVNRPSAFVVKLTIAPVAVSFRTTAAPGTAAPVESVTVPLMDPVVDVWASAKGSEMKLAAVKPKAVAKTSFRHFLLMQSCMTRPHTCTRGASIPQSLRRFLCSGSMRARSKPMHVGVSGHN